MTNERIDVLAPVLIVRDARFVIARHCDNYASLCGQLDATADAMSALIGVSSRMLTFENSEYVPNTMFDQLRAALARVGAA